MVSSRKAPHFSSMGMSITAPALPGLSKLDTLLAEAQSSLREGKIPRAMAFTEEAVQLADTAATRLALATVCLVAGDLRHAESNYVKALRHQPRDFKALLGLGQLKLNVNKPESAIKLLEQAVDLKPRNIDARHLLARSYALGNRVDEALKVFETLAREAPTNCGIWAGYGRALAHRGKVEEAIHAYNKANDLNSSDDAVHQGLSASYLATGKLKLAEFHAKEAIRLRPDRGTPYQGLGKMKRLGGLDLGPLQRRLAELAPDDSRRVHCLSAIAMAAEESGDYKTCFEAVTDALSIRARQSPIAYDPPSLSRFADDIIATIGQSSRALDSILPGPRPIYIVGVPRSGTTLTEQVLARHPEVHAAGESTALNEVVQAMGGTLGQAYPLFLARLNTQNVRDFRALYYAKIGPTEPSKTTLTDKLLKNTFYLPLIALMFPDARIVKCRRHPMDALWSIMSQAFGRTLPFANKVENICHYMLGEDRIFEAWKKHSTLPTIELYYEEFVERFETGVRTLLDFARLPWDQACLSPQESSRPVRTASAGQVHQPVSKSSIGRWKPFAPYLADASEMLKPLIERHEAELARRGVAISS